MLSDQHTMALERVSPDGTEIWSCHTCSRRVAVRWSPTVAQLVVEPGDDEMFHLSDSAALGSLSAAPMDAEVLPDSPAGQATYALGGTAHAFGTASAVDSFIDFGDPEITDGLAPWIRFLDQLSRNGD